jgi:hypothetical protein
VVSGLGIAASVTFANPAACHPCTVLRRVRIHCCAARILDFPRSSFLAGSAAAGAIALINSFGALGGFIAPIIKNWAEGAFQTPAPPASTCCRYHVIAAALMHGHPAAQVELRRTSCRPINTDRHSLESQESSMSTPTIKHVRAFVLRGGGADYHDQGDGHWIDDHIATPMSKYPEYRQSRRSFGINVLGTLVVEIEDSATAPSVSP